MRNGSRLTRIERLVPTDGSEERRVRAAVFEVFKESMERIAVGDRALFRERSRHQRAVGEVPDPYDLLWRDAWGRCLGYGFAPDATGEMRRVEFDAPPLDVVLATIVAASRAWAERHREQECALCGAESQLVDPSAAERERVDALELR